MPLAQDHNGIIRNYTVSITEENTGEQFLFTSHTLSQRVDSFHPYYNYTVAVAAVTVGTGLFSEPITITTGEAGTMAATLAHLSRVLRVRATVYPRKRGSS
jgi:receptor-type tyrosine-protein phosphatase Q